MRGKAHSLFEDLRGGKGPGEFIGTPGLRRMIAVIAVGIVILAVLAAWAVWHATGVDMFWCHACGRETWHRRHVVFDKKSWECLNCGEWHKRRKGPW